MALLARLEFLTGDRNGQHVELVEDYVTFGRHPMCTVAFDAEQELEVSGRHAALFRDGTLYVLRDLGSTNGTFVNGQRLRDDHILATHDEVQFGMRGPRLRFHLASEPPKVPPPTVAPSPRHYSPIPPRRTKEENAPEDAEAPAPARGTTTRVRAEVARRTAGMRRTVWLLVVGVLALAGVVTIQLLTHERGLESERAALLDRVDSLMSEMASVTGRLQSLQSTLDSGQAEMARLRSAISLGQSAEDFDRLRQETQTRIERHQRLLSAAGALDLPALAAANQPAVALVVVEGRDGRVFTGTGFAVASDARGGVVLTNKHLVLDDQGRPPRRVGVVFHGSGQNFAAEVGAIHPTQDAALLRVAVGGGVPVVRPATDGPPPPGSAVAVIGYPLGLDLPKGHAWRRVGVSSTIMAATITRTRPGLLQLDGYGTEGSSGSPLFAPNGTAVGFLYGGERGTGGRILYGLPIGVGLELLELER